VIETLSRLSDLLRFAIDETHPQTVALSEELNFLDGYLAIQQVRFDDRLKVDLKIAAQSLDALVPFMILQPIVENAIEHGMAGDEEPISVNVEVSRRGDDLLVGITDTGPGFSVGVRREGLGLANTRARLLELYGNRCRFEYGNLPAGGAWVRISIPFRVAAAAAVGRVAGADRGLEAPNAVASRL